MSTHLRHLNALRAFESAARHSSFAKAAEELHVSHSVISQHVRNLELWFGTALFTRHGNRIELTEDGRTLLPHLSTAFQTLRDACYGLLRMTQKGTVTVSAEPAIASRWLRKKITDFCNEFPKVEVDLKPAWNPPRMGDGHADMIIHFETRMPSSGARQTRMFPLDGFPACSPALKDHLTSASQHADFGSLPLIHDNGRQIWQTWFATHEPTSEHWKSGRLYSDLSLAIDAAVDGEGVILADDILCARELASGSLVRLDERLIRCIWYSIAIPKQTSLNAAVSALQSWLIESCKVVSA